MDNSKKTENIRKIEDALFKFERNIYILDTLHNYVTEGPNNPNERQVDFILYELIENFSEVFEDIRTGIDNL